MSGGPPVPFASLTTLRVGGPAGNVVRPVSEEEIVETVRAVDAEREALLVMGAGSNLLVGDEGFSGVVVQVANRGVAVNDGQLLVSAGEPWDDLVARCVAGGLSGIECLSGIPGLTGATPIQNVGAYGQEVSERIVSVRAFDRDADQVVDLAPEQCGFGYRTSAFKGSDRHVVLAVTFELEPTGMAQPVRYPELARTAGERPSLVEAREAVLALRRSKGMVLDPADPDSVSAGSFFLNPLVSAEQHARLDRDMPAWRQEDGRVKLSAAWLIEHAGFSRGYGNGRVGISSKHTLAIVNRGGASAQEIVALARELRDGVQDAFGVTLTPEPKLVGIDL